MPSKKKARGKARKAVKAEQKDAAANNVVKSGVLDSQMERLQIKNDNQNEDVLLEEAIKLAAAEKEKLEAAAKNDEANNTVQCYHGFVLFTEGDVCAAFIQYFDST